MRLWIKLLIGVLALGLLLVAGAAVFISQVDPNEYRGAIADAVEGATGRKLHIGGDLRISLLPVPSLEANDVTLGNASWASQPYMVRARYVRADVALLPLLAGDLVIRRFDAIEPQVSLQTDADGKGNWQFADAGEPVADSGGSSARMDVVVNQVRIEKAGVDYVDGRTGRKTNLQVAEMIFGSAGLGQRVSVALRATYQGLPVSLTGRLGEPGAILRQQPFDLDLKGQLGDATFSIAGSVGRLVEGHELSLDIALQSPSTKAISDAAGAAIEEMGPLDIQLRVVAEDGHLHLEPVKVSARPRNTDTHIRGSVKNIALHHLAGAGADAGDAAQKSLVVDLQADVGEAHLRVAGDVAFPLDAGASRLDVSADTKTTHWLTQLAGVEFEEVGPLKLSLLVSGKNGTFDLESIDLTARPRDTDASIKGSIKGLVLDPKRSSTSSQPAKVNVNGALGQARFKIAGDVAEPMQAKGLRLQVDVNAQSTPALTALAGVDVEEVGPLSMQLMVIEKNGRFNLDDINLTARPRHARVSVTGSIQDIANDPRPELDVALSAKNLRELDKALPPAGPVNVSAKVRPSAEVIEIRELVARVGTSDLSGSATVDTAGDRLRVAAKLGSKLIDLTELTPAAKAAGSASGVGKAADGRIFSGDALPLDALNKINADIELTVARLITHKLALADVDLIAKLDNGDLMVKPAAQIAGGTIGGTISVDSRAKPATFTADVDANKVSIGTLTTELRGYETSKGLDSNLKLKLRAQGDSVRTLMGDLDGDIRLDIGKGQLNNQVLDRVGADLLTQIISVAVPTDEKAKTTAFNCGVVRFAVKQGDAVADQTLVMETEKVLLTGGGVVDLKTEKLDLGAHLAARKGIRIGTGTLSSLMRVQGTLAEPRLGTDLKGVVTTGAKLGIAVATAGLSLLAESVYGHVSEDGNPCQTALTRKIEANPNVLKSLLK